MTRYTVVWVSDASDELAAIWLAAPDKNAVAAAANAIDAELADDPAAKGTLLREGLRILVDPPLRVLFSINDADRIVEVAWVQRT